MDSWMLAIFQLLSLWTWIFWFNLFSVFFEITALSRLSKRASLCHWDKIAAFLCFFCSHRRNLLVLCSVATTPTTYLTLTQLNEDATQSHRGWSSQEGWRSAQHDSGPTGGALQLTKVVADVVFACFRQIDVYYICIYLYCYILYI